MYFTIGLLVFDILGEELSWRGYILARQELAIGRWAWVSHRALWTVFHAIHQYNLGILVSYADHAGHRFAARRTRNTWPGIVGHLVSNLGIPLLMLSRLLASPGV